MGRTDREYSASSGQRAIYIHSCPHKACEVWNVLIASDLHELGSLVPGPLEDHGTVISNETARDEEPGIRSAELHPPDLF